MPLSAIMDSLDGLSEDIAALYTEKDGKFELTGITGVKTAADVQRVQRALDHEKSNHQATKDSLGAWGDLKHDEVIVQLDRIPELEAAAKGKLDEAQIEEIVERRVQGTLRSQLAPLERQLATVTKERDTALEENTGFRKRETRRTIQDAVGAVLREAKVIEHAREDALLQAERIFKVSQDDATGQTLISSDDGTTPKDWILDIQAKNAKPHWWGPTSGGGANPGKHGAASGDNPWAKDSWNLTRQGAILREKGREHADRLAKAAGHRSSQGALKRDAK